MNWKTLLICLAMGIAAAQEPPKERCIFNGSGTVATLAEVTTPKANAYCIGKENCWPTTLAAGDVMLVYRAEDEWSCGYLQRRDGAGPTWLLSTDGSAEWHGANDNVHLGQVEGSAAPAGNHLKIVESADGCQVDLTLVSKYIVASDNNKCGGMNVQFGGVWKRRGN